MLINCGWRSLLHLTPACCCRWRWMLHRQWHANVEGRGGERQRHESRLVQKQVCWIPVLWPAGTCVWATTCLLGLFSFLHSLLHLVDSIALFNSKLGFYICTNQVSNTVLSSIICQLSVAFLFKIVCKSTVFVNRTQRSAIVGIHCTSLTLIPKPRTLNAAIHALVIQQSLVEAPTDWTFTFSRQEVSL